LRWAEPRPMNPNQISKGFTLSELILNCIWPGSLRRKTWKKLCLYVTTI